MNWWQLIAKYWLEVGFGIICSAMGVAYKYLNKKIQRKSIEDAAMKEAILSLLDDRMGMMYRYCKEKGSTTREEVRRYERMYKAYSGLGGNGAVTNEHKQFSEIEIKDK